MKNQEHLGYLDGWRGLAILTLLLGHFFPLPGLNLARLGVELFFVLSGLLMSRLLFIKQVPLSSFYKRRFSRVFPAHYVFLILTCLVLVGIGSQVDYSETLEAATFTTNYFHHSSTRVMPFGHIWSLCVEEHCYLVLGLVAFCTRQYPRLTIPAITALALTCIGFACFYSWRTHQRDAFYDVWLHTEVSGYGIFVSAVIAIICARFPPTKKLSYAVPVLLMIALAVQWWSVPNEIRLILGVSCLAFSVNLLSVAPRLIQTALSVKPLRLLGIYSFSIYLWQQPFYLAGDDAHPSRLYSLAMLAIALLCGVLSFHVIEHPIRNYLNKNWTRSPNRQ